MTEPRKLRITEIFHSLQGESRSVGLPTVFVRLTGCPLRCQYCDTAYAFEGGTQTSLDEIVERVQNFGAAYVTVTGGEPLAQPNCIPLLSQLCDLGLNVSLETGGAMSIADVDDRVSVVLDLKTPGSMEAHRNMYENIALLRSKDQVKFVICDRKDYEWSRARVEQYDLASRAGEILFSPSWGEVRPADLAQWVLDDRLPVRMQLQLHKLIWGEEPGR